MKILIIYLICSFLLVLICDIAMIRKEYKEGAPVTGRDLSVFFLFNIFSSIIWWLVLWFTLDAFGVLDKIKDNWEKFLDYKFFDPNKDK